MAEACLTGAAGIIVRVACGGEVSRTNLGGVAPIKDIIARAGGPAKLAASLGITSAAVSQWTRVPAERVLAVARASGLPAHDIRPDLYPEPERAA